MSPKNNRFVEANPDKPPTKGTEKIRKRIGAAPQAQKVKTVLGPKDSNLKGIRVGDMVRRGVGNVTITVPEPSGVSVVEIIIDRRLSKSKQRRQIWKARKLAAKSTSHRRKK